MWSERYSNCLFYGYYYSSFRKIHLFRKEECTLKRLILVKMEEITVLFPYSLIEDIKKSIEKTLKNYKK